MRIAVPAWTAAALLLSPACFAAVDGFGNEKVTIDRSSVPMIGTQQVPNVHAPLSGSLTDASTPSLGTGTVTALSQCGDTTPGDPPSGCANGTARAYLTVANQNNVTGSLAYLCLRFGPVPATCVPGTGSYILAPGQTRTWEGSEVPPDQVTWTCGQATCAALLESK